MSIDGDVWLKINCPTPYGGLKSCRTCHYASFYDDKEFPGLPFIKCDIWCLEDEERIYG